MSKFRSIIIGAPGSGKGTISSRIVKSFSVKHISSGEILRQHVSRGTEIGTYARSFILSGTLLPDDVMDKIVLPELKELKNENWLLDGYPRTRSQCDRLASVVSVNCCINLVVPFDVIKDRLQNRWIHAPSGRVYNLGFNDPKVPGLDDMTGEKLVQREDDKPESVQNRLNVYSQTMGPVIEYYQQAGILRDFCGKTSDEIWPDVLEYVQSYFKN